MLNTYPSNPFPPSTEQMHRGDNDDLQAQINAIKDGTDIDSFGDVETALDTKADNDVIAPEFDAEAGTYEIGDKVMYEGKLYEFTSAHDTAGEWDPTEVTETTVADGLSSLESGLMSLLNNLKVVSVQSGTNRKIKITRSYDKQYFLVMTNNNYHPFFGIISQLDGATNHLQSVPTNTGVTVSLTDNTFEFTLASYFGGLTIISNTDFTVTAEPVTS